MKSRLNYSEVSPDALKAMLGLEKYVHQSDLESSLIELVKMRASQLNSCAYCIDMHSKDARKAGETEQRLYALSAWHETPFFSERERAALEWTEALTKLSSTHITDELYDSVKQHFTDEEIVVLTMSIVAINGWNRLGVGFKSEVGNYQP